ncbi:MAG: diguanylate cyclase [Cyanobacteriota bacterium]|nr:diguanylate cyclase [Cyanobacteriota bacterium]
MDINHGCNSSSRKPSSLERGDRAAYESISEALHECETRYQALVELQTDYICRFLPDGTLTFVNRAYCRYTGQLPHKSIGTPVFGWLEPAERHAWQKQLRSVTPSDREVTHFHQSISPSGEKSWQQWIDRAIFDRHGHLIEFQSVGRAITELEQVKEALHASEERLRLLLAGLKDYALYLLDPTGSIVSWNIGAENIYRLKADDAISSHFSRFFLPEDRQRGKPLEVLRQTVDRHKLEVEGPRLRADGTQFWAHVVLTALWDEQGNLRGFANVTRDISERKQIEETLRQQAEQERFLSRITQHILQSLDLRDILNTAVGSIREFLQCDRVAIYQFQSQNRGKVVAEAAIDPWKKMLGTEIQDTCLTQKHFHAYQQGRISAIADIQNAHLSPCYVERLSEWDVRANLVVSILQGNKLWGLLVAQQCSEPRHWQRSEIKFVSQLTAQVGIAIQQSQLYEQLQQANQELQRLVTIDGLTEIANRRAFDITLKREWGRLAREHGPLSLILCDVDFFKGYNDSYGHQAGDDCLRLVARTMQQTVKRPSDIVARYGGEEFAAILPDTHAEGAIRVARKIRTRIKALKIPHEGSKVNRVVTLSLGVATRWPDRKSTWRDLIAEADRALYRAKEQGRDRVWTEG